MMIIQHRVFPPYCLFLSFFVMACLSSPHIQGLRVASLNMNGGRDAQKRALVTEVIQQKKLDVVFLQETHSDSRNETDWGLWWGGPHVLSHGTHLSAGVAILFSPLLNIKIISSTEEVKGRVILVKAEIDDFLISFINVYAPNQGSEREEIFKVLEERISDIGQGEFIVLGGDWNCCTDFTLDRTGVEPHLQSSSVLSHVVKKSDLVDVWRRMHPTCKQYTWVQISHGRVSAARLDRFYLPKAFSARVTNCQIIPVAFTDHHLVLMELILSSNGKPRSFWHFNNRLLQDLNFCEQFKMFWAYWRSRKDGFSSLTQWWEVGKAQIKVFCQQYTSYSTANIKRVVENLEKEITDLESVSQADPQNNASLKEKRQELNSFMQERAKGALVRARFTKLQDIDAPTAFFFSLEKSVVKRKQMLCLRLPEGKVTTEPAEMRKHAVDFYTDLFRADECDVDSAAELLEGLPQLSLEGQNTLSSELTHDELTAAVSQMASGKAPGIDGLSSDFFKHFWSLMGQDILDVFKECFEKGMLPASSRRAVLSLLPKKGDLTSLKNWRPVALLCTDYKILSKVLSNRLKLFIGQLIVVDQSYCVPDRSMLDSLFLMRDVFDICKVYNINAGIISIDQEKAFDRVDHNFLFTTLQAFGVGEGFLSWVRILYHEAFCVIKVGGGLSVPVPVGRGIRQGCPISGQLYSIAIEPLLCRLRSRLRGLCLPEMSHSPPVVVSAYADDIDIIIQDHTDVQELKESLALYEKASSARVNWGKSEAVLVGQWRVGDIPSLPGGIRWGRRGIKVLGVQLGTDEFQKQNWEGVLDKVEAKLSKWKWLLPQLSYRGRALIVNNLVASSLWHKLIVLAPPPGLVKELQRCLVNFFWSGQHWLKASALYLPVAEGGQGLIDIQSRTAAFRLQTAQRLLYGSGQRWLDPARLLLRKAGRLGMDKHLFLIRTTEADLTGLTSFYRSVINAWQTLKVTRTPDQRPGMWLFEEPLQKNDLFPTATFSSVALGTKFVEAGITKLGHLTGTSVETLSNTINIRSSRVLQRIVEDIMQSLSPPERAFIEDPVRLETWKEENDYEFPSLTVSPAVGEWQEERGKLLSLKTPILGSFSSCGKKQLYQCCVKTLNIRLLAEVKESRWNEFFPSDFTPKGRWRVLYKRPVEKRMADLQWRIIHGALATNRHRAHLDPSAGEECPFCQQSETVEHLVVSCTRLAGLFGLLKGWVEGLGEVFSLLLEIKINIQ